MRGRIAEPRFVNEGLRTLDSLGEKDIFVRISGVSPVIPDLSVRVVPVRDTEIVNCIETWDTTQKLSDSLMSVHNLVVCKFIRIFLFLFT